MTEQKPMRWCDVSDSSFQFEPHGYDGMLPPIAARENELWINR
jgi:hypothetical protein